MKFPIPSLHNRGQGTPLVNRVLACQPGMAESMTSTSNDNQDTELQRQVVQAAYAEIAPRAEHWIRGVQDAFCVPATI